MYNVITELRKEVNNNDEAQTNIERTESKNNLQKKQMYHREYKEQGVSCKGRILSIR